MIDLLILCAASVVFACIASYYFGEYRAWQYLNEPHAATPPTPEFPAEEQLVDEIVSNIAAVEYLGITTSAVDVIVPTVPPSNSELRARRMRAWRARQ